MYRLTSKKLLKSKNTRSKVIQAEVTFSFDQFIKDNAVRRYFLLGAVSLPLPFTVEQYETNVLLKMRKKEKIA